jgi:DNA-binding transcriptional regulator YdaS (Cro superfamily)
MGDLTRNEALALLALKIAERFGSQAKFAASLGVKRQHVNQALKGRRPPSQEMWTAVGLSVEKIITYRVAEAAQ